jgi:hypothetical protein
MEQAQGFDQWQRFVLGASLVSDIGDTAVWVFVKQKQLIIIPGTLHCVQVL